jgi:hypothetical protein
MNASLLALAFGNFVIGTGTLIVLAGCTFAASDPGGSPEKPLEVRDLHIDSPSSGASVPELPGALAGERVPLLRYPYLEQRQYPGPRPYWETDPLFVTPLP